MGCLGNLIWFLFGGIWLGLGWVLAGLLWCITVVGIPVGIQCFKFAQLSFFPFGKEVRYGGGSGDDAAEYPLADSQRLAACSRGRVDWMPVELDDYRHSDRDTVF